LPCVIYFVSETQITRILIFRDLMLHRCVSGSWYSERMYRLNLQVQNVGNR